MTWRDRSEVQWGIGVAVVLAVAALGALVLDPSAPATATGDDACAACTGFATGQPLTEPRRIVTRDGRLDATLTARMSTVRIGGRAVRSQVYNGQFPGPTLVVDPGDELAVTLRNRLVADYLPYGASSDDSPPVFPGQPYAGFPQPLGNLTNLHVHDMHVSPKTPSDDVLLTIRPGRQFRYRYAIPADHPAGLFWYHPHRHQFVDQQVGQGQAGMIIVRGGLDEVPGVKGLRDRLLVFQNVEVKDGVTTSSQYQTPEHRLITINGQVQPRIDLRPGETQRWRIANASTERFLSLVWTGDAEVWRIAFDGNPMAKPKPLQRIFLGPGQRAEVLIRAGDDPGTFQLIQEKFNQRPTPYGKQPRVKVADIRIAGRAATPSPIPTRLMAVEDLRGDHVEIARKRTIRFTQSPPKFFIDGKLFEDRDGKVHGPTFDVEVGTVEEWTIRNDSPEWHNFHIHINDYQVVARDGIRTRGQPEWADSVIIKPNHSVTVRLPFRNFDGTWVFHCHVLVHEDHGMMALVNGTR